MTVNEIIQKVIQKLDSDQTFYTQEEIIKNGINPAQRLLVLLKPELLNHRVTVSVATNEMFIDLRSAAPRSWKLRRVMLGTITGDAPTRSALGEFREVLPSTLRSISMKPRWLSDRGQVSHYYHHGRHWLGLYKRPSAATTLTLIYRAIPTAFTIADMASEPDIKSAYHPLIASLGAAMLLIKEGAVEHQKAMSLLAEDIGLDLFGNTEKATGREQREGGVVPQETTV